jgi:hypothetical protein
MLSKRRHFITVVYVGPNEPRRVSSHHREEPPPEALPLDNTLTGKGNASPGGDAPADNGAEAAPAPAETPATSETKPGEPAEGKTKSAEESPPEK